ncbi:zinc ribbon domain-containing protein [Massilia cavernae]|uniref:Serine endopeptidase n=1 Tax=Massilia cavernae TaxID=2320864 RepID=A0A418XAR0_9BURK|nr:zinc ribbon domain-containing protein [Massilia cavernae]RJG09537.1 serine endopeptidase [Massilia cavernae]
MSKSLRLTEKWMQRGLWLVAIIFAGFLIGLGGKIVHNLWRVEEPVLVSHYIDPVQGPQVKAAAERARALLENAQAAHDQARLRHEAAQSNSRSAEQTSSNWLRTRKATERPEQDPELIARTRDLDGLKAAERVALAAVEAQQQAMLDASQSRERAAQAWRKLEEPAIRAAERAGRASELRVFLYRLALTLPLLLIAGWLFAHKRQSRYWPFVWGFIFFAGFAFFVELVPYLPSYGGYVRYAVGIVLTVIVGRFAIISLQRYLDRQKASEAMPDTARRATLRYDTAVARLSKSVCPGCERAVDLKDGATDFCPHCGIGLFDRCRQCSTRKSAFARFCFSCGSHGNASLAD